MSIKEAIGGQLASMQGISAAWSGLCYWIEADEQAIQQWGGMLMALGARWSRKRGQWYIRIEEPAI